MAELAVLKVRQDVSENSITSPKVFMGKFKQLSWQYDLAIGEMEMRRSFDYCYTVPHTYTVAKLEGFIIHAR